ncbi:hypothetical protein [Agreia sp. Leaf210]|uniref:hypothetical protein n=1 Tax=Agreia sp. Leaf210 TaxID=1735682 RepID=UPI0012E15A73|nr:hypothetical protein [Agreia sp. Leaf210]
MTPLSAEFKRILMGLSVVAFALAVAAAAFAIGNALTNPTFAATPLAAVPLAAEMGFLLLRPPSPKKLIASVAVSGIGAVVFIVGFFFPEMNVAFAIGTLAAWALSTAISRSADR